MKTVNDIGTNLKRNNLIKKTVTNNRLAIIQTQTQESNAVLIKMTIDEFLNKYNSDYKKSTKYIAFYSRSFCFFGHWFGRPTDITFEILGAEYDFENKVLKILLDQKATLEIKNPSEIGETEFELFIKNAEYILLKWTHFLDDAKNYFIKISTQNSELIGESNLEENFNDLSIEKPAVSWKW